MRVLFGGVRVMAICLAALGGSVLRADLQAQQSDALARIKIAAQQRALVQTMAKSTCYLMADISPQMQAEQAFIASVVFEENITALRSGEAEGIVAAENDATILADLDRVEEVWRTFGPASRQVMSGDFHTVPVQQLIALNPLVAAHLETLVSHVATTYKERLVTRQDMISTVTHAAGQSMLARKAVKELCYIGLDLLPAEMRADLVQSIERFEQIMAAMEMGDYDMGIVDPPSLAAIKQVMAMKDLWAELRPLLDHGVKSGEIDRETLVQAAALSDEMVALTDGMVALYLD